MTNILIVVVPNISDLVCENQIFHNEELAISYRDISDYIIWFETLIILATGKRIFVISPI